MWDNIRTMMMRMKRMMMMITWYQDRRTVYTCISDGWLQFVDNGLFPSPVPSAAPPGSASLDRNTAWRRDDNALIWEKFYQIHLRIAYPRLGQDVWQVQLIPGFLATAGLLHKIIVVVVVDCTEFIFSSFQCQPLEAPGSVSQAARHQNPV